ncbi:hypothetical protein AAF712_001987 [Marasmius tenuissimus]|uniref:BHLH domain-containing protein n=1 Tax=Marasmius tenuissimus TaxID=585030 RepID=A0ABR3AA29_9AGAR
MPENAETASRSPLPKSPSLKDSNLKLSPILPLAPLEYLQNQRRGSITDPSLHAAHKGAPPPFRPHADPSASLNSTAPSTFITDNYTFGDATPRPPASDSTPLRRLLHSPSHDQGATTSASPPNGKAAREAPRRASIDPMSLRRPSTTGPEVAQSYLGKRKMSLDRVLPGVEDSEGIPSGPSRPGRPGASAGGMEVDMEGPAPKRRSSALTRGQRWGRWREDGGHRARRRARRVETVREPEKDEIRRLQRQASPPSLFPALNSANPGGEGRAPPGVAGFAWTTSSHPAAAEIMHNESIDPHSRPQFDPNQPQIPSIPPLSFHPERRMSAPDTTVAISTGPTRVLRSRSRPPSRQMRNSEPSNHQASPSPGQEDPSMQGQSSGSTSKIDKSSTPYSRSPELRVSHKLAERKRRKEMKDLFDELRDQLPADRGMKASKWEILSKAIEFVQQLKQSHQDMAREIDMLRGELDLLRQNPNPLAQFPPGAPVVYGQGHPHPVPGPYPMHAPPGVLPHPHPPPPHPQHPQQQQPPHSGPPQPPLSRPASSQNMYPPTPGSNAHPHPSHQQPSAAPPQQRQQNGTIGRAEVPPT